MPEKILDLLETASLTEWQLAEQLNVSIEDVKACIEFLCNAGYIKASILNCAQGGCGNGCSGSCKSCGGACSSHSSTGTENQVKIWEITA